MNARLFACIIAFLGCERTYEVVEPIYDSCEYHSWVDTMHPGAVVNLVVRQADGTIKRVALTREEGELRYIYKIDMAANTWYLVEVDNVVRQDHRNPLTKAANGQTWSYLPERTCGMPSLTFVNREKRNERPYLVFQMKRVREGVGLDPNSVHAETKNNILPVEVIGDQILVDTSTLTRGKYELKITATDTLARPIDDFAHPIWVGDDFTWSAALLYQIVVDRFAGFSEVPSDEWTIGRRRGGTWQGIREKIEAGYFQRMGVDAIWISPVNQNPDGLWKGVEGGRPRYEGYHGYWRISNHDLESAFGDEDDLKALVNTAHENGIRVLVDIVLNHRHRNFVGGDDRDVRLNEGCICGQSVCNWGIAIEHCWFTEYLPDLDYTAPQLLERELADIESLVRRFDFDGLRVDAVPMMPRYVTRHLRMHMREAFEGAGTPFLLLGETFTDEGGSEHIRYFLGAHGLHGQFDFPLMWTLRRVFGPEAAKAATLIERWYHSQSMWGKNARHMGYMIGNHDVPRFSTAALGRGFGEAWTNPMPQPDEQDTYQRTLLAQAFVFGLPGIATLYYGDEIALAGGYDPDNRRPFPWDSTLKDWQTQMRETLNVLGRTRRCMANSLGLAVRFLNTHDRFISFARSSLSGRPRLLALFNPGDAINEQTIALDSFSEKASDWTDTLTGEHFRLERHELRVPMAPGQLRWLLPSDDDCQEVN